MIPTEKLASARTPEGGELVLYRRGGDYTIRVDGRELMSSRAHGSEEAMARLACEGLREEARVLVGGLGMGYTLRAALDALSPRATVVVAELVPAVVDWNRTFLAPLGCRPLEDPRVVVEVGDVLAIVRATDVRFDAILLDVDNGPTALTRPGNQALYGEPGLVTLKRALRLSGALAVWSADRAPAFEARLRKVGFAVSVHEIPARGGAGGPPHTIYLGRLGAARAGGRSRT